MIKTVTIEFSKGGTRYDYITTYPVRKGQWVEIYSEWTGLSVVKVVSTSRGVSEKATQKIKRVVKNHRK